MHDQAATLHWLECGGGSLILLAGEDVPAWLGYTRAEAVGGASSGGMRPSERTDYERAHAGQDDLGLLTVDGEQGLVVSTEPMAIAWWAIAPAEGILVCWMVGEEEAAVMQVFARLEEQTWTSSGLTYVVGKHPLYIFDAISPGREATEYTEYLVEHLLVRLDAGRYDVDTGCARPDTQTDRN